MRSKVKRSNSNSCRGTLHILRIGNMRRRMRGNLARLACRPRCRGRSAAMYRPDFANPDCPELRRRGKFSDYQFFLTRRFEMMPLAIRIIDDVARARQTASRWRRPIGALQQRVTSRPCSRPAPLGHDRVKMMAMVTLPGGRMTSRRRKAPAANSGADG